MRSHFYNLRCDRFQDIYIGLCQFDSCLTRFTCDTGGDNYDVRVFRIFVFTGNDGDRVSEAGSLCDIHDFAFYFFFVNVDQDDL